MNFLNDDKNNPSAMRLMCFLSLLASFGLSAYSVKIESNIGVDLTLAFLICAFAPKAAQKLVEKWRS